MTSRNTSLFVAFLAVALIAGCGQARKEYEQQLEVCTAGENNGVLTAAAESCGNALEIARQNEFPPDEISDLAYRLGQIERRQGRFEEAEALLQSSLEHEMQSSDAVGAAGRLVELSFSLAGQNRWEEGVALLERAAPHIQDLTATERDAAGNALRAYAAQEYGMDLKAETEQVFGAPPLIFKSALGGDYAGAINFFPTFYLYGMSTRFFHDPDS